MKQLIEKIKTDGVVMPGNVLLVDSFINHQVDVELISACGKEWYERFKDAGVTKIMTIESAGIGIACLTAQYFGVPVVYAKKTRSANYGSDFYSTKVVSYTHGQSYDVVVSKRYIDKNDRILIIDDFLANGSALKALISLTEQAGATVVGAGVAIEKVYQGGGNDIRRMGYKVKSLAMISSVNSDGKIEFC